MLIPINNIPITGEELTLNIEQRDLHLDTKMLQPVRFSGTAYRSGQDVRVKGGFSTQIEVSCHRCLEPFPLKINTEIDLFYRPAFTNSQKEDISVEELGVLYYQDNVVNLADAIRDTIILETPMKILCVPECLGLCGKCGKNLNLATCNCKKDTASRNPFEEFFKNNPQ